MSLTRSAPLRRTPFKNKARAQHQVERPPRVLPVVVPGLFRLPALITKVAQPVIKEVIVRDEAYLRLVAARPCANCGLVGFSQAAHENNGKGMSLKVSDLLTMPLCHVGGNDCHGRFDLYRLFASRADHILAGRSWVIECASAIHAEGNWPRKYPFPY